MAPLPASVLLQKGQVEELIDQLSQLPIYTIGRRADNKITLANGKISGQHARLIQCSETSYVLEDLDSKNGTFVNGQRVVRKIVGNTDIIRLADADYTIQQLIELALPGKITSEEKHPVNPPGVENDRVKSPASLDFSHEFSELKPVYEQYPKLRRDCRNREKMIRTGSVILSSIIGVSATVATGGAAVPILHIISGAGLGVLIPTLCSTLLSTEEKLEVIDKEYRERYRCPNPTCRDPFHPREWDLLAQQKTCRRCQAIWVN